MVCRTLLNPWVKVMGWSEKARMNPSLLPDQTRRTANRGVVTKPTNAIRSQVSYMIKHYDDEETNQKHMRFDSGALGLPALNRRTAKPSPLLSDTFCAFTTIMPAMFLGAMRALSMSTTRMRVVTKQQVLEPYSWMRSSAGTCTRPPGWWWWWWWCGTTRQQQVNPMHHHHCRSSRPG